MPAINYGDTAWMLVSTALVMAMTAPGLAMFYGGLVRRKNVLSTMMQSFFILCLISVQWVLWGYSLAFGPDAGHFIGNLSWFALRGVGLAPNADYAATIPHQLFMVYQMMFAVITPALITGAFAERIKFSTFVVFTLLWATLVYDPDRPLGVGQGRMAAQPGRARLRGRDGRAHLFGRFGPDLRAGHREADRLSHGSPRRRTT